MMEHARLLACGLLAGLPAGATLMAQERTYRSVQDVRQWVPDGSWEVREGSVAVAANTNLADAQWAAAEIAKAQAQTAKLIARFAPQQAKGELPPDSLQVAINARPRQGRGAAATTINVVGIQTQVQLDVSPGQPKLKDQVERLRGAAAFAALHAREIDVVLPPAVVMGLASHVGSQVVTSNTAAPQQPALLEQLAGDQWRWQRSAPGLRREPLPLAAAAEQAGFLIAGNDAQFAPETLAVLSATYDERAVRTEGAGQGGGRSTRQSLAQLESRLAVLAAQHQATFNAWREDPLVGQPEFTPDEKLPADVVSQQRDMLVVLKLQRRIAAAQSPTPRVKVATFDRAQGRAVPAASPAKEPISIAALASRLRDTLQPPLATIDVDGSLLLSTDRERLVGLLGNDERRYTVEQSGEQWVLATRLADGRVLQGWLVENPERQSRPVAKFAIVEAPKPDEESVPALQPQKSAGRPGVIER